MPPHYFTGELRYEHPSGFSLTPAVEWVPRAYFVDSENRRENPAWWTLGVRAEWALARTGATIFASAENLTDERFARSVQVDNAAGRSFEPAEPRSVYVGLRWAR